MVDLLRLTQPFPPSALKQRSGGGGKMLTYVEGHTVIHRLNDATDNNWSFSVDKIERIEVDQNNALLMAYVTLEIPELGRRSHIGVQGVNARGGEDLVKGAVTDALKKAATLFGVGLELYGPDYEAGEMSGPSGTEVPSRGRTTTVNTIPKESEVATKPGRDPWTIFWEEARAAGLNNWEQITKAIGSGQDDFRNGSEALEALRAKTQAVAS